MSPLRTFLIPLVAAFALAPATALAQYDSDDPLLSGYGGPGAAEQAVFEEQGIGAGGPGGSGGSGPSAPAPAPVPTDDAGAPDLRTPPPLAGTPSGGAARSPGGKRAGRPGQGDASAPAPATAEDGVVPVPLQRFDGVRASGGSDGAGLPLSAVDLALLGVFLLVLLGAVVAARRRVNPTPIA